MKPLNTYLVLALFCVGLTVNAQKTLEDFANYPDKKFFKKTTSRNYSSYVKSWKKSYSKRGQDIAPDARPNPKKVGLLTLFLSDLSKTNSKAILRGGVFENYLSEDGGIIFLKELAEPALPQLVKAFAEDGRELLFPKEFADTSEKKEVYYNTEIPLSGLAKKMLKLSSYFTKERQKNPFVPSDMALHEAPAVLFGEDGKTCKMIGDFAKKLDLDGVLSVKFTTSLDGKKLSLKGVTINLHTVNPIAKDPNQKWIGGYFSGILAESIVLDLEKPIVFAVLGKKGSLKSMNTKGFDKVISRMTTKLLENLEADYTKK